MRGWALYRTQVTGECDKARGQWCVDGLKCWGTEQNSFEGKTDRSRDKKSAQALLERNTLLVQAYSPLQVDEARIAAHRIEEGMHLEELQNLGLFLVSFLEPEERLVVLV